MKMSIETASMIVGIIILIILVIQTILIDAFQDMRHNIKEDVEKKEQSVDKGEEE